MQSFKINRTKSEAPVMAVFAGFAIAISLLFFPRILRYSFLAFPLMAVAFLILKRLNLGLFSKKTFLVTDEEGMKFCFNLFQQPKSLLWSQVEKVNYQMYEINLRLKESGTMISIQVSYLEDPSQLDDLKAAINAHCQVV